MSKLFGFDPEPISHFRDGIFFNYANQPFEAVTDDQLEYFYRREKENFEKLEKFLATDRPYVFISVNTEPKPISLTPKKLF